MHEGFYSSCIFIFCMKQDNINPSLAIGVIIKNDFDEVLIVQEKNDKYYEKSSGVWGLPSGKVEWEESIESGLKRELHEELGVKIEPVGLVGVYQYCRDSSQCIGLAFVVDLVSAPEQIKINQNELHDYKWMKINDIMNSSLTFRHGNREVLLDYQKGKILPFVNIRFFDLKN